MKNETYNKDEALGYMNQRRRRVGRSEITMAAFRRYIYITRQLSVGVYERSQKVWTRDQLDSLFKRTTRGNSRSNDPTDMTPSHVLKSYGNSCIDAGIFYRGRQVTWIEKHPRLQRYYLITFKDGDKLEIWNNAKLVCPQAAPDYGVKTS